MGFVEVRTVQAASLPELVKTRGWWWNDNVLPPLTVNVHGRWRAVLHVWAESADVDGEAFLADAKSHFADYYAGDGNKAEKFSELVESQVYSTNPVNLAVEYLAEEDGEDGGLSGRLAILRLAEPVQVLMPVGATWPQPAEDDTAERHADCTPDGCRHADDSEPVRLWGGFTPDELETLARSAAELFMEYGDGNDVLSERQEDLCRRAHRTVKDEDGEF